MNKIIVVGHPQSGYEKLGQLLVASGMQVALPSRHEGLTPLQISEILVKVHGAIPVQKIRSIEPLKQIDVAPVWRGMILDLMLANINQSLWGWTDTQAIYLLEYWKTQDPQMVFVLVFDEPQGIFMRQTLEQAQASPEEWTERINAWMAYHTALLQFHEANPQRSLLVHVQQAKESMQSCLQQIGERVRVPLQLPDTMQKPKSAAMGKLASASLEDELEENVLAHWLAQQMMNDYPEATRLYAQLQAAASLPQRQVVSASASCLLADSKSYRAWNIFVTLQKALREQAEQIKKIPQ